MPANLDRFYSDILNTEDGDFGNSCSTVVASCRYPAVDSWIGTVASSSSSASRLPKQPCVVAKTGTHTKAIRHEQGDTPAARAARLKTQPFG